MLYKKVLWEIWQNSEEDTCARVSVLMKLQAYSLKLYQKSYSSTSFTFEFCQISQKLILLNLLNCFCCLSCCFTCSRSERQKYFLRRCPLKKVNTLLLQSQISNTSSGPPTKEIPPSSRPTKLYQFLLTLKPFPKKITKALATTLFPHIFPRMDKQYTIHWVDRTKTSLQWPAATYQNWMVKYSPQALECCWIYQLLFFLALESITGSLFLAGNSW